MTANHIFSWYCKENVPRLIQRPWWAFWRHDELVLESRSVRKVVRLTEDEATQVQNSQLKGVGVLMKLMGREVCHVQLEVEGLHSPYIPSEYVSVGEKL